MNGLKRDQGRKQKLSEKNENDHTTVQNLWDTVKAVLRENFIVIQAYLKNIETFQIDKLTSCLQKLEEQQETKPSASGREDITEIRAELNDIETKRTIQRSVNPRAGSFKR